MNDRKQTLLETAVFVSLIWTGVALRWHFQYLPNFAPVAALALFSGYFFRHGLVALAVPILVMLISDTRIGGYHPAMMVCVYTMLALPVAARPVLRKRFRDAGQGWRRAVIAVAGLIGCALVASLAFFFVTNFATWLFGQIYAHTWAGLVDCYVQALPFLRYTLTGDLVFATVLFGGHALAVTCVFDHPHAAEPVA